MFCVLPVTFLSAGLRLSQLLCQTFERSGAAVLSANSHCVTVSFHSPNGKAAAFFIFVHKTVLVSESEFFKVKPSLPTALCCNVLAAVFISLTDCQDAR